MTPEERKAAAEVMASDGPNPIVRYMNIYDNAEYATVSDSRGEADKSNLGGRIACVRVEYLPGQFDE